MPEQEPRKNLASAIASSGPIVLLILMAAILSAPIFTELFRASLWFVENRSTINLDDLGLSIHRFPLLIRSISVAGLIALIGLCMGIPLARILASGLQSARRRIIAAILLVPIWLPATMVYAAGNLMRAPDSIIGHALITYATSGDSHRWVTIWAGYAIAIIGLGIWSAPIAGILIASGLGVRSNLYSEMLALEPVGLLGRARFWIRLNLRVLVRAWTLITILMFGSATALHLAQLETWSIVIWRQLAEKTADQWGGIWISAYPTLIAALLGARILTHSLLKRDIQSQIEDRSNHEQTLPRALFVLAFSVFALGALLPLFAMLLSLNDLRSLIQFWRLEASAVRDSGIIALITGGVGLVVAALIAMNLGHPSVIRRRLASLSFFVLCILGLLPGVLIGAAIARSPFTFLSTGWSGAILASCMRAAFLGAIIGALCASTESAERKSIRWQLAGGSIRGWISTAMPGFSMPMLASGLISALYSFFEIEASVMVRPPGMNNLPQQILSDLHYSRLEQLSAAGVNLLLIGFVGSLLAMLLLIRFGNSGNSGR